jgi:glycosyltransferase involved in cell wall biosynthesis
VTPLQLTTSDRRGGAAIAAYRLHEGLRGIGINSRILVGQKTTEDSDVLQARPDNTTWRDSAWKKFDRFLISRARAPYRKTRSAKLELFSDDRIPGRSWASDRLPQADVYNLHWVAGFVDYRRFLGRIPVGSPLVWTLHDMNPFTGGCHYSLGCESFARACGSCRQLGSNNPGDLSAQIHARKMDALARLDPGTTRIVSPSHWLLGEARRSTLLRRFDAVCIPNSIDTSVFAPQSKVRSREIFNLPADRPVVLFTAEAVSNHRKGFDLLTAALGQLRRRDVSLVAIGKGDKISAAPIPVTHLGPIADEEQLALAYAAADVFVLPTRADNLPNVLLEALATGIPVVSFDVGGVPDVIRDNCTGLLAKAEDAGDLAAAIEAILADETLRNRLATECRRVAVAEYALGVQARRYEALYAGLIEVSRLAAR